MINTYITRLGILLVATAIGSTGTLCAKKKKPKAPEPALTESGQQLENDYVRQLAALKSEITGKLPPVNKGKQESFMKALEAEEAAVKALSEAKKGMGDIKKGQGMVAHAKGKWIGGADKGIAAAKAKLKKATTDEERKAAEEELATWQKNREEGVAALKERQAFLDKAEQKRPQLEAALKKAEAQLAAAKAATLAAIKDLQLAPMLSNNQLDTQLAKYAVIQEATPRGLAAFAEQGADKKKLVDELLGDGELLVKMATADGAADGNYGRAMEIYRDIHKASDKAADGPLSRLAIAVSLEHAKPIKQRNAVGEQNAPEIVDPVKRYLHFEKAFLAKELDPAFADLSIWDYRMVVNGEEPDHILSWGREMLRNYRPDHVTTKDYRWRYVALVRSDIRYGSQDNKCDRDDLQFFQNILMNGGICGRRAFIGRFILRAFGIPTTARPQPGHAALTHWTPDGWVVCLGGGWGAGTTKTRYKKDLDFLATTQARMTGDPFMQVKRAQWIGNVMGEAPVYGIHDRNTPQFWYAASLYTQKGIITDAKAKTLAAVGEDIGEANVTKEHVEIAKVDITEEDREISINGDGVINIPAAATSKPTKSTGKILFLDSVLGGKQLHFSRNGGNQTFEYIFEAPSAGTYEITAKVVTPSWQQNLLLTANASEPVKIELPHTVGMWETTKPVQVELKEGQNVLQFNHNSDGYEKGFSIKNFTLTPAAK